MWSNDNVKQDIEIANGYTALQLRLAQDPNANPIQVADVNRMVEHPVGAGSTAVMRELSKQAIKLRGVSPSQ